LPTGGIDPLVHICGFCAAQAVAQTTPQPSPEPSTPRVPPSKEERFALVPSSKSVVAHLDQHVIGQEVDLALGVSNHFKRAVDTWVADDAIVTDPDLYTVRIWMSHILLIGSSSSGKTHPARSIASYLTVPIVIGDEPRRTVPGRSRGRVRNDREAGGTGTACFAAAGARCVFSPRVTYALSDVK
jgi:ATP-dependent protease Clp ATPase subunit